MSIKIDIDSLPQETREKIIKDLTVSPDVAHKKRQSFYTPSTPPIELFQILGDDVVLPFAYGISEMKLKKPKRETYDKMDEKSSSFVGTLRDTQKNIKDEAIGFLNENGAVLISCFPGFGKTITSIYIATRIKLKTLILTHRIILIKQWEDSIRKFCPGAKIQVLNPKKKIDTESDFIIANAINIGKFGCDFFSKIGTVIVDEAHLIMSKVLSQSLQFLFPKYLIGLSATPYRSDGLNILLDHYFTKNKIIRKLKREHIVYKIETQFTPEVEYDRNGKVNWGKIIESQSNNEGRNQIILDIAKRHTDRNILILTKRIEQAKFLHSNLLDSGENVDILIESETSFNRDCRILIGTTSKTGVGFDHDKLDMLILASDLEEYFIQYLGRVFRKLDIIPIIFDLVDDNSILKKHFATRKNVYLESGGKIIKYKI